MSAEASSEVFRHDAVELVRRLKARELSCVELMEATLKQIDALNPTFNAIVALRSREECLAEAKAKDAGPTCGVLFGLPLAVKDLAAATGMRMTMGSPLLERFVPSEDSIFVERLRAAGAIFIGKTNTPEFGLGSQTYNPVHGATRNAYDPALTAGGSSGGAAVALALRMVALSDGSDYGGSLRNPAGWNNVYGLRPSIGRVPGDGREAWLPSMGVNGPMARNPVDLALLLSVMAGYDPREPLSLEGNGAEFAARLGEPRKALRIAWAADWNGAFPCEHGVLAVVRAGAQGLRAPRLRGRARRSRLFLRRIVGGLRSPALLAGEREPPALLERPREPQAPEARGPVGGRMRREALSLRHFGRIGGADALHSRHAALPRRL